MKSFLISLPIVMLIVLLFTQTSADPNQSKADATSYTQNHINVLENSCYQNWEALNWTLGESNAPAKQNPAFSEGIHRVCQARAELFFEGYELSPFIAPDSQAEVYPLVFQASVTQIKNQLKLHLPKLRLI